MAAFLPFRNNPQLVPTKKTIESIDLSRIDELAKQAGYIPKPVVTALDMLTNSQADVIFVRFAYLIAKELAD